MNSKITSDVCIIGGGVIGLAIARHLSGHGQPNSRSVLLLEKNTQLGQEISSRNSQVIHTGLYYPASFLKTTACVRGNHLLYAFCDEYDVPYRRCGKLVVANSDEEHEFLHALAYRAENNGVSGIRMLSHRMLKQQQPFLQAKSALWSPTSGIIDSVRYQQTLERHCYDRGVDIALNTQVDSIQQNGQGLLLSCSDSSSCQRYTVQAETVINAAGLNAIAVARSVENFPTALLPEMILMKGNYFSYKAKNPFQHLVYPVPCTSHSLGTSSLGIHATPNMQGMLRFGPDTEVVDEINFHVDEKRKPEFIAAIKAFFPDLDETQLQADFAGIRPRLKTENNQTADFIIQSEQQHGIKGLVNLLGIESPGLTASLALAEEVHNIL